MQVMYDRCCGLDVHKKRLSACLLVLDPPHPRHKEVRSFGTTTSDLVQLRAWLTNAGCTHIAMESTGSYWKPVYNLLEDAFALVLANAQHIKALPGRKTDVGDAEWIADLLQHGLIRPSFIPPKPLRELREVTRILPCLAISQEGIAYYASLVGYYTATRLNELDSWMVYVYMLCFLHHRYRRLHDHLLTGFVQAVKGYRDEAMAAAETQSAAYRVTLTQDLIRAGVVLQRFTDDQIPPELPFTILQERAFKLLERERLIHTATYMTTGVGYDETACFWQAIDTMARRFKGRLRPL
jgi:hypothetical protein